MIDWLQRLVSMVRIRLWNMRARACLAASNVCFGSGLRCYGLPIISRAPDSSIHIGDAVVLCSDSRYTALGVAHPVILRTLRPGARIRIGNHCGLSGTTICAAVEVSIGDECLFGADVAVFDTDFHAIAPRGRRYNNAPEAIGTAPVVIEDNVFIGTGARILKGVRIGRDSVIGAGAIITRDVAAGSIVVSLAATVKRSLYTAGEHPSPDTAGGC